MPPALRNANGGNNNATGAPVAMTQQQLNALLNDIVSQVNAANAARVANPRNNAVPSYAIPPEQVANAVTGDMKDSPHGKRFKDGIDVKITDVQWQELDQQILGLTNADVHALCNENVEHPHDYALLDADTLDAVLANLKKSGHPLKAHTQKMVKYWRCFAQFLDNTDRYIRGEHFTKDAIMSCGLQLRVLEDSKDAKDTPSKLPKLTNLTDPLAWIDNAMKVFAQLTGNDNLPLGYIIRHDVIVEVDPRDDDSRIIPGKCYSKKHGLLRNELIACRTHNDGVYDNNNVIVYNHMETALKGTKFASILTEYEKTKDGRAVWLALMKYHGGEERWEKSYTTLNKALSSPPWKSSADVTLETRIGLFKLIFDRMELACEYTSHTPFTEREKVPKLLDSLDNNDADLKASIAQICADLPGLGSDFQACCSLLIPVDPVEAKITKSGSKRGFDAMVSATSFLGRGSSTGVDLCWYPNKEFKTLSPEQRAELRAWRQMLDSDGKGLSALYIIFT